MLGGYALLVIGTVLGGQLAAAVPLALLVMLVIALIIYILVIRPVVGMPTFTAILVTIGLSIILRSLMVLIWGPEVILMAKDLHVKDSAMSLPIGGVVSLTDIYMVGTAIVFICLLAIFLKFTKPGELK